jgi:hypothetical protein
VVGESDSRLVVALVLHGWDRLVESLRAEGIQQRARCPGEFFGQEAPEQRTEMCGAVRHDRVHALDAVQPTDDGQAVGRDGTDADVCAKQVRRSECGQQRPGA